MEKAYGLQTLNEFVKTILLSNNLADAKPLSAVIIGRADTGKTETVMQYAKNDCVFVASDITGYGLASLMGEIGKKEIRVIIVPDFSRIFEGRGGSADTLISAFNSVIEEGVYNIKTKNVNIELSKSKSPVKVSLLGTLTIASYAERKQAWAELGFLSRIIPFFLNYTQHDIDKALSTIMKQEKVFTEEKMLFADEGTVVSITDEQKLILKKVSKFIAETNADFTSFRTFKNLIYLAQSHALYRRDTVVKDDDMRFVKSLLPFWLFGGSTKESKGGNDCEFQILQILPQKLSGVLDFLQNEYDETTIVKNMEILKIKGIIEEKESIWYMVV